ncbi:MAG: aspartate aminotransferase family protein [Thaumarchaeota archaeon]|nr:aspartate aminotransferase family protein [Nitrososphaerota archaeon]
MFGDRYIQRTPQSKKLFEEAKNYLPGGVSYVIRFFEPYPFYVSKAEGQKVWDIDGNAYTDYWMGHGALLMGHRYSPVIEAIKDQLDLIPHAGFSHEWEVKLAKQVIKMVDSVELIRFTNSGTEAAMYSIRLARAYTGKKLIGKFEGGWHGGYDALHLAVSPPYELPGSLGITEGALKDTVILPYNDLDGVHRIIKGLELAAIIVEPVLGAGGFIPSDPEFLKGLRELCDEMDALLIFDEVITGFRLSPGGAQKLYGVKPDLTVFGKILGGGEFPAGGFGGRRDVMELLDQLKYKDPHKRAFQGGTFAANPITTRAGYTLLSELQRRSEIYNYINGLGEKARNALQRIFDERGFNAHVTGIGSLFAVHFTPVKPKDSKTAQQKKDVNLARSYFKHLLDNGIVVMVQDMQHFFISSSHKSQDIDMLIDVTQDFIDKI